MKLQISSTIKREFPHIEDWLDEIAYWAYQEDGDIDLDNLLVSVRIGRRPTLWSGQAWPYSTSLDRRTGKRRRHSSGHIGLSLGRRNRKSEITRIFAHELRHIGQFARGREKLGYLTSSHMSNREGERDARLFEQRVMKHMGVTDEYWWRDLGYLYKPKKKPVPA